MANILIASIILGIAVVAYALLADLAVAPALLRAFYRADAKA